MEGEKASQGQKRLFFALVSDLGVDADIGKERAKKHFSLEHFSDITSKQISELIELMQSKIAWEE